MDLNTNTTEQLQINRYNLQNEYNMIKTTLLQKINRMEEIEKEVKKLDEELIKRNTK